MKTIRLMIGVFLVALLSGCFATSGYGSRYGSGGSTTNATILGGGGAILGGALMKRDPVVGMVIGGVGGYLVGREMDNREDAQGWTECRADIYRNYNRDGSIADVKDNSERCTSRVRYGGYRRGYNQ